MDECLGDSSVSASPWGPPWRPRRLGFQLWSSNSPPPQPPFTLCCLFVRRTPGHQKRRFPELPELETIWGSILNIARGKHCTQTRHRAGLCTRPLGGVCSPGQLQPFERGFGQYLTLEEFWSWVPFSCTLRECGAWGRQRVCPQGRRWAGGAVQRLQMCAWGWGCQKGVFAFSCKFQTNHYMEQQGKNK